MSNREFSLQFGIYTGPYDKCMLSPTFSSIIGATFWICIPENEAFLLNTLKDCSKNIDKEKLFAAQLFLVDHISGEIDSSLKESGFFNLKLIHEVEDYLNELFDIEENQ